MSTENNKNEKEELITSEKYSKNKPKINHEKEELEEEQMSENENQSIMSTTETQLTENKNNNTEKDDKVNMKRFRALSAEYESNNNYMRKERIRTLSEGDFNNITSGKILEANIEYIFEKIYRRFADLKMDFLPRNKSHNYKLNELYCALLDTRTELVKLYRELKADDDFEGRIVINNATPYDTNFDLTSRGNDLLVKFMNEFSNFRVRESCKSKAQYEKAVIDLIQWWNETTNDYELIVHHNTNKCICCNIL